MSRRHLGGASRYEPADRLSDRHWRVVWAEHLRRHPGQGPTFLAAVLSNGPPTVSGGLGAATHGSWEAVLQRGARAACSDCWSVMKMNIGRAASIWRRARLLWSRSC